MKLIGYSYYFKFQPIDLLSHEEAQRTSINIQRDKLPKAETHLAELLAMLQK